MLTIAFRTHSLVLQTGGIGGWGNLALVNEMYHAAVQEIVTKNPEPFCVLRYPTLLKKIRSFPMEIFCAFQSLTMVALKVVVFSN